MNLERRDHFPAGDGDDVLQDDIDPDLDPELLLSWKQDYDDLLVVPPWRAQTLVRRARQQRSARRAYRVGATAAAVVAVASVLHLSGRPPEDPLPVPAVTGTYSFTTKGCVRDASTCAAVVQSWLAQHGQTPTEPVRFLPAKPSPPNHMPIRFEPGYVSAEIRLVTDDPAAPLDLIIWVSPTTTMPIVPPAEWGDGGASVPVTVKGGSVARWLAPGTSGSWQVGESLHLPAQTGVHPAIDIGLSRANLSNSGWTPALPKDIDRAAVLALVNSML